MGLLSPEVYKHQVQGLRHEGLKISTRRVEGLRLQCAFHLLQGVAESSPGISALCMLEFLKGATPTSISREALQIALRPSMGERISKTKRTRPSPITISLFPRKVPVHNMLVLFNCCSGVLELTRASISLSGTMNEGCNIQMGPTGFLVAKLLCLQARCGQRSLYVLVKKLATKNRSKGADPERRRIPDCCRGIRLRCF